MSVAECSICRSHAWRSPNTAPRSTAAAIATGVIAARVRHLDETGFCIDGKTRWLYSTSTAVYTLHRIGRRPRRTGHDLLLRLHDCKDDVLRFIADYDVLFTNNQAEWDIRMMKLRMKISGDFRTLADAEMVATMRSVISTTRKHGINILPALTVLNDDLMGLLST